jgi:hypothetical protein
MVDVDINENVKKWLEQLKTWLDSAKIYNISFNIVKNQLLKDNKKIYLEIDRKENNKRNLTDAKKIYIIQKSFFCLEKFKIKMLEHHNNYFLFELLEEESTNENN